jgi:hypothetical protein
MGSLFAKPKAPDQAAIAAAQEAAAKKERERIAMEDAAAKNSAKESAVMKAQALESKRRAFAGQLTKEGEADANKRFLKGA